MFKGIANIKQICLIQKTKVEREVEVGQPFTVASKSHS